MTQASQQSHRLDMMNTSSSQISQIEMNFQNQDSRPSAPSARSGFAISNRLPGRLSASQAPVDTNVQNTNAMVDQ